MSINNKMDKSIVICSKAEILHSNENKYISTISNNKVAAEGKKSDTEEIIPHDSICIKF